MNYNTADQLTSSVTGANTTVYGWDQTNGFRTSQGPSGNPSQITYTYTAAGQLATYADSGASPAITATYSYDAAGQRVKSAVTVGGTTTTTTFAYDGITLLSLAATQGSTSWRVDYLYDEEGVAYGGVYRSPSTSSSPTYFTMVCNDHGDVLELLDASGNAFAAYRYDAWGIPQGGANGIQSQATALVTSTLAAQIASRQLLRYASYAYDAESGLYYCSARSYDPATRQFTTADSAKADGEQSAYQYCGGDPVGKVDPSGSRYIQKWVSIDPDTFVKEPWFSRKDVLAWKMQIEVDYGLFGRDWYITEVDLHAEKPPYGGYMDHLPINVVWSEFQMRRIEQRSTSNSSIWHRVASKNNTRGLIPFAYQDWTGAVKTQYFTWQPNLCSRREVGGKAGTKIWFSVDVTSGPDNDRRIRGNFSGTLYLPKRRA